MNNISTDFMPEENTTGADSTTQVDSSSPLLPRSAWNNYLAYLKVVFKAKKALDRIEKEADVLKSLTTRREVPRSLASGSVGMKDRDRLVMF